MFLLLDLIEQFFKLLIIQGVAHILFNTFAALILFFVLIQLQLYIVVKLVKLLFKLLEIINHTLEVFL